MAEVEMGARINARVNSKTSVINMIMKDRVFILNQFSRFQFSEDSFQCRSRLRDDVFTSDGVCF